MRLSFPQFFFYSNAVGCFGTRNAPKSPHLVHSRLTGGWLVIRGTALTNHPPLVRRYRAVAVALTAAASRQSPPESPTRPSCRQQLPSPAATATAACTLAAATCRLSPSRRVRAAARTLAAPAGAPSCRDVGQVDPGPRRRSRIGRAFAARRCPACSRCGPAGWHGAWLSCAAAAASSSQGEPAIDVFVVAVEGCVEAEPLV